MTKAERQNRLLECIKDNHHISANTLAEKLGVSKRTILRDIQDLEDKGVQILAHQGKHGGYQITNDTDKYVLSMTEREITTLFLLLN
ncbi:helix-turn-helix transcriptional regulator, partial [Staphylococcus massiliensis]